MMQLSAKHPTMEMKNPVQRTGGGGIEQVQADWEQENQEAVDYIKNKPDIDGINTAISTINSILEHKPDTEELASVAFSGDYDDLTNSPIGVSYFNNDAGYLTAHQDISGKANTADLASVAFSGDYEDLINKPVVEPTEYTVQFQNFFVSFPRFQLVDNTDENETIRDNLRTGNVKINRVLSLQYDPLNSLPTDNYIYNDYQLIQDIRKTNSQEIILYKRLVDFGGTQVPTMLYEDYLIFYFQSNLSLYIFHYYNPKQNFEINVSVGYDTLPKTVTVAENKVWGKNNLAKAKKIYAPWSTTLRVGMNIQGDNIFLNPYETISSNSLPRYYGESKKLGKKFVITFSDFEDGVQPTALVEEVSETQIQADWNQADITALDYIKNKPTAVSAFTNDTGYLTTHQDISGKADKTARVEKTASDTTATIDPNKLYVWPTMASLNITLNTGDSDIVNEYHFIFTSGTTATNLTLPQTVKKPYGFTVEANTTYEVSILENCMVVQRWEA